MRQLTKQMWMVSLAAALAIGACSSSDDDSSAATSSDSGSTTGDTTTSADGADGTEAADGADGTDMVDATDTTNATDAGDTTDPNNRTDAGDLPDGTDMPDVADGTDTPDVADGTDMTDVADGTDMTDVADGTDMTDVADGTDMTDVADGTDMTDVADGTDMTDVADGTDMTDGMDGPDVPVGEYEVVARPASFGLNDEFSKLAHESDRFGVITYGYSADSFSLEVPTKLVSADFFGEFQSGFYNVFPAFSIYIFPNTDANVPAGNPELDAPLVKLERIESGEGAEGTELAGDAYNVAVDFTLANDGTDLVLPPGDYWMVAAVYGPDADAGDPTLSWFWRFSPDPAPFAPQFMAHWDPVWGPVENFKSGTVAEGMAWTLIGEVVAE